MEELRKLATIEKIVAIREIPSAENIVAAQIRGWEVVVQKDEFKAGDYCVYFEVDSLLDVTKPQFAFLAPRGVSTDAEGNSGHALKTVRLRGQYSQGLAIHPSHFSHLGEFNDSRVGEDLTNDSQLNVIKWEYPIPENIAELVVGRIPSWIGGTSEVRIQNTFSILSHANDWDATEKIDGESTTYFVDNELEGACTRNYSLRFDSNSSTWKTAKNLDLFSLLRGSGLGPRVAIQGEAFGPGFKKNKLGIKTPSFKIFNLKTPEGFIPRNLWPQWAKDYATPIYDFELPKTLEEALKQAEKLKSLINPERYAEGIVWRSPEHSEILIDGLPVRASFKVISNSYLLKNS